MKIEINERNTKRMLVIVTLISAFLFLSGFFSAVNAQRRHRLRRKPVKARKVLAPDDSRIACRVENRLVEGQQAIIFHLPDHVLFTEETRRYILPYKVEDPQYVKDLATAVPKTREIIFTREFFVFKGDYNFDEWMQNADAFRAMMRGDDGVKPFVVLKWIDCTKPGAKCAPLVLPSAIAPAVVTKKEAPYVPAKP